MRSSPATATRASLSLADIARRLGRDRVQALGLIKRFELPSFAAAGYPLSYLSFLQAIVFLRLAQISEDRLLELWSLERKLMTLLHADTLGSPTWMLDGHLHKGGDSQRLFLSRFDLGADLGMASLQPGLNFSAPATELFAGKDMGEDALRILRAYLELLEPVRSALREQAAILHAAARWARASAP